MTGPTIPRLSECCLDRGGIWDAMDVRRVGATETGSLIEVPAAWGCCVAANDVGRKGRGPAPAPGSGWTLARVLLGCREITEGVCTPVGTRDRFCS